MENNLGIVLLTALKILFTFQMHKAIKILKLHHKYLMGGDIEITVPKYKEKIIIE